MNVRLAMCLLSALMATTGMLMVGGGIWIVVDLEDPTDIIQGRQDLEKIVVHANQLTDSNQDSFSLFSRSRGWQNFGFVSIVMGLAALVVVFFGVCGFKKDEYVCLCLLYITLITTFTILQIFTMILIKRREKEMEVVLDKQFSYPKLVFFVFSSSISLAALMLAIALLLLVTKFAKKYDGFGQLLSYMRM